MNADVLALVKELDQLCHQRRLRIGLAESCTGGLLSSWICTWPGVSRWFQGAVVSYARHVKVHTLEVPDALIQTHGEVSVPVARAMASGARRVLDCDWAVSVTGIAGPSGGSPQKPVGSVCFAVRGPSGTEIYEQRLFRPPGLEREAIQAEAAHYAFTLLLKAIKQ